MKSLEIRPAELPASCEALRNDVRAFAQQHLSELNPVDRSKGWTAFDTEFTKKMAAKGWIGMTWPKTYGGGEKSAFERYVVLEELLAAGAPMSAHWVGDRQSGALLMHFSPDVWAPRLLPQIISGDITFCIGMSEPDSGSDLASVRTRAERKDGGWLINGRKVWTTNAHRSHYMIALVRTTANPEKKHLGLSQFLIPMDTPGITVSAIHSQDGTHDLNEVTLDNVWLPDEHLIGKEGDGWKQVTTELAFERSGPERYMSSIQLMKAMLDQADASNDRHAVDLGRKVAQYATLRQMSLGVTGMIVEGKSPALAAACVKDQGALLEQDVVNVAQDLFSESMDADSDMALILKTTLLDAPCFSLRGGTREILRGIVSKGL